MTISLLHIVVPTVLALAVLIIYMNTCNKRVLKEIGQLKAQLEKLDNVSELPEPQTVVNNTVQPETEPLTEKDDKEEQDVPEPELEATDTSAYNTGKSGKIYTKEELELLIKE